MIMMMMVLIMLLKGHKLQNAKTERVDPKTS